VNGLELDARPVYATVCAHTDRGQLRPDNQDEFLVAALDACADGALRPLRAASKDPRCARFSVGPKGLLAIVADGMGGAAAGAIASELAVTAIQRDLALHWNADRDNSPRQFAARLRDAVEAANADLYRIAQQNPECRGMGTTATVAGVLDGFLYTAQVGDSRAYLIRKGSAVQITRDQSVAQELIDAGVMSTDEAERSAHGNVLLQALGTRPDVQVDLGYQELRRGDVVVLCSDGLYRVVDPDDIAQAAAHSADPADLVARMVRLANERGGPDNITVVSIAFDGAGLQVPRELDFVGRSPYVIPDDRESRSAGTVDVV
jgi:protein phosphatase